MPTAATSPLSLDELPRPALLRVGLETMMLGHLIDRALMPQVVLHARSVDAVEGVAIDEWMGASPNYTRRMRELMGIEGDDVGAIMKALQLDVGFVHQYMAVGYKLIDARHGEFWLDHCGALLDVEPHGEARVIGMCHHIEDPTFDASAFATNPRARIRPIHRPPRVPVDRMPHCHWTIEIDPANDPVGPAALTERVGALPLAHIRNQRTPGRDEGGARDYRGPLDPRFRLSNLADGTLAAVTREFQVQSHLIVSAAELAITERFGVEAARGIVGRQMIGAGWVASERFAAACDYEPGAGGATALAVILMLHPALPPGFDRTVESDGRQVRLTLTPTDPALLDPEQPGWVGGVARAETAGIEAILHGIDRRARLRGLRIDDGRIVIDAAIDDAAEPAEAPEAVALARLGNTPSWKFDTRDRN